LPKSYGSTALSLCAVVASEPPRQIRVDLLAPAAKGSRATTRTEYDLYRATVRAMGFQSMATAAARSFECCQRVCGAFGFEDAEDAEDAEGAERCGIAWAEYQPGKQIAVVQSKTGNPVVLPLAIEVGGGGAALSGSRGRARAHAAGRGRDRRGRAPRPEIPDRHVSSVGRAICVQARLPKDMTFIGFQQGGITEVGSLGANVRPVPGHATPDVTRIKATAANAQESAVARRTHIIQLEDYLSKSMTEHVEQT